MSADINVTYRAAIARMLGKRSREPFAAQIRALTARHIARYEAMIRKARAGSRDYRLPECEYLLGVWRSTERKDAQLALLAGDELRELFEAIEQDEPSVGGEPWIEGPPRV